MSFQNIYTHRKVAETAAKGCDICFKPTSSVLITVENKDFFYVCPTHLRDRTFCKPIVDEAAEAAKKKKREAEAKERELKAEMERVKKEYEEKQKTKKSKEEKKKKGDDDKDEKKDDDDKEKKGDKDKDKKEKTNKDGTETDAPLQEDEPRVFALHKFVYQQRLEKRRQAEIAKRNRERLANPNFFPSVPKDLP